MHRFIPRQRDVDQLGAAATDLNAVRRRSAMQTFRQLGLQALGMTAVSCGLLAAMPEIGALRPLACASAAFAGLAAVLSLCDRVCLRRGWVTPGSGVSPAFAYATGATLSVGIWLTFVHGLSAAAAIGAGTAMLAYALLSTPADDPAPRFPGNLFTAKEPQPMIDWQATRTRVPRSNLRAVPDLRDRLALSRFDVGYALFSAPAHSLRRCFGSRTARPGRPASQTGSERRRCG